MAKRKRKSGPLHRAYGYPAGDKLTDFEGKTIGKIVNKSCAKVPPHARGGWISSQRCSYTVEIGGRKYTGRGRGEGMGVSLRQMKGRSGLGGKR